VLHRLPLERKIFADSAYAGDKVATATTIAMEIVRRLPDHKDSRPRSPPATAFLYAAASCYSRGGLDSSKGRSRTGAISYLV
jgi:hypothetical protein